MTPWLDTVPKWWQVLVALVALLTGAVGGTLGTLRWMGWQDAAPASRLAAAEERDSALAVRLAAQEARLLAVRDSVHSEVAAVKDSLWVAIRELREVQDASLRLQCAQTPELYQRLARVRCR